MYVCTCLQFVSRSGVSSEICQNFKKCMWHALYTCSFVQHGAKDSQYHTIINLGVNAHWSLMLFFIYLVCYVASTIQKTTIRSFRCHSFCYYIIHQWRSL